MVGLSKELLESCYAVLMQCQEFDSQAASRAVFITDELSPYRDRLPDAGNRLDRVYLTVDYLHRQYLRDGRPVFPFFITALSSKRSPEDRIHHELIKLHDELDSALSPVRTVVVPFGVVAMTADEAIALECEEVFADPAVAPIELQQYQKLRSALDDHQITDWTSRYKQSREGWTPHTYPDLSIHELILRIVDHSNQAHREPQKLPVLHIESLSEGFFDDANSSRQTRSWERINGSGGVLVADAISLFHPMVRQTLLQSGVLANQKVAMVVLSPVDPSTIQVNHIIETLVRTKMKLLFSRFGEHLDTLCEIGTGDIRSLQRWLMVAFPQTATTVQDGVLEFNNRLLQERVTQKAKGLAEAIFSTGGTL